MARLRKVTAARNKGKQAVDLWEEAFNAIPELVSIHGQNFYVVKVNKAFLDTIDLPSDQIIGKKCFEVMHGMTEPGPGCPHQRTLQSKKFESEEFYEPRLGIYLHVSCLPIVNDNNEIIGSVHIAHDISEQKNRACLKEKRKGFSPSCSETNT